MLGGVGQEFADNLDAFIVGDVDGGLIAEGLAMQVLPGCGGTGSVHGLLAEHETYMIDEGM